MLKYDEGISPDGFSLLSRHRIYNFLVESLTLHSGGCVPPLSHPSYLENQLDTATDTLDKYCHFLPPILIQLTRRPIGFQAQRVLTVALTHCGWEALKC
ncbi:hypothetical protein AVEN_25239-1 [Araneus ventricosus]|uniref:Uncharacterized protein n=1 Tax=Araneus ventricosus TaxID=182803 RepID=A0A4Y2WXE8_ARAVE|nr:hypothetical protein AVEN_25239-1 [Araneus ventricosus]